MKNSNSTAFKEKFEKNQQILKEIRLHKKDLKQSAFILQLSTLLFFVTAIPIGNILGPIIVWFFYKDKYLELKDFYYEILNFQISFWIYTAIAGFLCFIFIGYLLLPIILISWLILTIIGFFNIYEGNYNYKYPFTKKFLRTTRIL